MSSAFYPSAFSDADVHMHEQLRRKVLADEARRTPQQKDDKKKLRVTSANVNGKTTAFFSCCDSIFKQTC